MPPLLELSALKVYFYTQDGVVKAVDGVSYSVNAGKTLGVVGESGCGKTVSAMAILRLISQPGKIVGGSIMFEGQDLTKIPEAKIRQVRGNRISMIFQEPMTALNPVFTIGNQIAEAVRLHRGASKQEAYDAAIKTLEKVGIPSPAKRVHEYPHQLSGGMRQRAMIAMALVLNPKLVIADEPTTALDVTIQAQILDLMMEMKEQYDASIIMITHDLGVVAQTCDDVVVMYAGRIVESATVKTLFANPAHPYTRGLLESIPSRHKDSHGHLKEIKGMVPSPIDLPTGCAFHPRCPDVMDVCKEKMPALKKCKTGATTACWLHG